MEGKEKEGEGVKNVMTHRKTETCSFKSYGREQERERAKKRKKDV